MKLISLTGESDRSSNYCEVPVKIRVCGEEFDECCLLDTGFEGHEVIIPSRRVLDNKEILNGGFSVVGSLETASSHRISVRVHEGTIIFKHSNYKMRVLILIGFVDNEKGGTEILDQEDITLGRGLIDNGDLVAIFDGKKKELRIEKH